MLISVRYGEVYVSKFLSVLFPVGFGKLFPGENRDLYWMYCDLCGGGTWAEDVSSPGVRCVLWKILLLPRTMKVGKCRPMCFSL